MKPRETDEQLRAYSILMAKLRQPAILTVKDGDGKIISSEVIL